MIEIRNAQSEDVPTVHQLGKDVDEFHTSDDAPNFWPMAILAQSVDKEDVYFFVAVSEGDVVGFIIANLNKSLSKALIENIFVKPDFRGQGVGTRLAEEVVKTAKSDKFQFISVLTPPDDTAAINTYEKVGFSRGENFLWLDIM